MFKLVDLGAKKWNNKATKKDLKMHLRESRTSKFSGLRQIYPPVTLKYPLEQKLIETPEWQWPYKIVKLMVLTNLKSFPSNFRAFVNTTVLAGMLRPRANVSVANKAWQKKKTNNLFVNKKPEIIMSWLVHRSTTTENVVFLGLEMERCSTVRICV